MVRLKKMLALTLAVFTIIMYCPNSSLSQELVKTSDSTIQTHPIEVRSTPNEELVLMSGKSTNWFLWGLAGIVVIGGAVAIAGSSSDEGSGTSTEPTGGATISW